MPKEHKEIEKVILKLTIEAEFEFNTFDNGSDIDTAIENALTELHGLGKANITSRKMYGVMK